MAQKENPDQRIVALPPDLLIGADYGMTILNGAGMNARSLAVFILSPDGQDILMQHGFTPPL